MPYNKKTAIENQKAFLRSQAKCGFPNIEQRAKESLRKIEEQEKAQRNLDLRIKAFNNRWELERKNKK